MDGTSKMTMASLLTVDRVIPRLHARDKQDALEKLAARIGKQLNLPAQPLKDAIMRSVELTSFGPGRGVALPHAFVRGVKTPTAIFARLDPALDFGAADGSPTDLVVLLVSSDEKGSTHLQALACIARRLREPKVRAHLRSLREAGSMYVVLAGDPGLPESVGDTGSPSIA
ncbi:MAG TPA: PTS sugar transporter subunit IIA [Pseudolabrys sp.]|nr:PTS sugar transporter subunit IIA [Pseudolabrys sp.]